jgi:hypothetical protein
MPNEGLGTAAIAAGDVNGDGFGDLLVTTPNAMGSDPVVSVFFGAAGGFSSTPSQVLSVPTGAVSFGTGVAAAGDVNGDGYGDVIIGSGQYLGVGSSSAYVYTGSSSGLASTPITIHGGSVSFGAFVGAGDTNGDGFGDVFVADSASHVVYLYRGSASGPSATADSTLNDALFTLRTGSTFLALDAGGDIDGDGYADLLIGASDLHQVHVYRCTPTGIAASAYASVAPAAGGAPARFVGDINGDGRGDFAVGDATGAGNAVYVYEGSATGAMLATTTTAASLGVGTTAYFGATLSGGADFDRDGIADFAIGAYNGGSAFLYRGSTLSPSVPLTFTRPATLATSYGNSLDL